MKLDSRNTIKKCYDFLFNFNIEFVLKHKSFVSIISFYRYFRISETLKDFDFTSKTFQSEIEKVVDQKFSNESIEKMIEKKLERKIEQMLDKTEMKRYVRLIQNDLLNVWKS